MIDTTKYFIAGRGAGKTHRCLLWAAQQFKKGERPVIAVHSDSEKVRLRGMWQEIHGVDAELPRIYTFSECRSGVVDGQGSCFAIDNINILLRHMFPYPVDLVTGTGEIL